MRRAMTGHELANKLLAMPDVDVMIQVKITHQGTELTGCWDTTDWADVGGIDNLENRIILTPKDE